ncbi:MAG: Lrp/AsnC family transcriptional regulator [Actinobacteria bacterium]|nr:Lrp/AsnC family transcriptional regulator [Actinomycetota bacterium]
MTQASPDLDHVDRAILAMLQQDGRMANVDLAEAVNLSPSACLRRVRRLEEAGVIDRYAALLDPARVGLGTDVFVEITLAGQDEATLDAFELAVAGRPEIMSCHLMAGDFDYLVHVVVSDVADYEVLHRTHLAQLPGVARMVSSFALRPICDRTAVPLGRSGG